jgi:hypothetical protein
MEPRIGFPARSPLAPTASIAPPAITINQHFHYHGEKPFAEQKEKEAVSDIETEMTQVMEKVQEIALERELKVQDIGQNEKGQEIVMETTLEVRAIQNVQ